ncbi:MAG: sulfatase [Bacteroidota bacterium]
MPFRLPSPTRALLTGSVLLVLMLLSACEAPTAPPTRPNIIYIMADDHARRTIGAYGDGLHTTPNLDRIAHEGALFLNSFCGNSICGPSRATILTGLHSHKNGVTGNSRPWDSTQTVFPSLLRQAGYQTALFGKWHLNNRPADEYDTYKILTGAGKQGFYYNPAFYDSETGRDTTMEGYATDLVTDEALRWLDTERSADDPFLLLVQYKAPHVPRMPPLRMLDRYLDDTIPEPPTLHDDLATRSVYARQVNFFLDEYRPLPAYGTYDPAAHTIYVARMSEAQLQAYHAAVDPQNEAYREMLASGALADSAAHRSYVYQRFIKDYLRIVDTIDENVGRLLDWLDAHPELRDNTVVVYASDQGYFTGEHGYAEKRLMYEAALQMPLLMRWPAGIAPGTRVESLVQNIDYAPTFLDLAGVPIPPTMQGRSLRPVLDAEAPPDWREAIYYHYYDHMRHRVGRHAGVRTARYKLIHFYTDDTWEFYDLEADPLEVRNVYGDPTYAEPIETMKATYERLRTTYEVPASTFEPPFAAP